MLSGATWSAAAIVGTAVLRIVVSSDSMKNATAISQGTSRLLESASGAGATEAFFGLEEVKELLPYFYFREFAFHGSDHVGVLFFTGAAR